MAKKQKKQKELHVIDGNNWVNRAFYSVHWQSMSNGEIYTAAIKTFIGMLDSLMRKVGDDKHYAICWDNKRDSTFRYHLQHKWMNRGTNKKKAYKHGYLKEGKSCEYKGNRNKVPDDPKEAKLKKEQQDSLREQIAWCKKITKALGIVNLQVDEYEADDIAGTLSKITGCHVYIYTRDKDYNQLVSKTCTVINPEQANSERKEWTPKTVKEVFGFKPSLFIDFLMLVGDTADNIMGVPGVADKTAIKLITEHGSVNKIMKAAPSIKGKARYLKCFRSEDGHIKPPFNLTRKLVTIVTDVPGVLMDIEDYALLPPDEKALKKLKKKLKLKSLIYV